MPKSSQSPFPELQHRGKSRPDHPPTASRQTRSRRSYPASRAQTTPAYFQEYDARPVRPDVRAEAVASYHWINKHGGEGHKQNCFSRRARRLGGEKNLSPNQNHGSACPCPETLSPFSLLPGIFSPVAPKRVSGRRPTGGRSIRAGCPVLSSPVRLLPCPQTFWA